MSTGSCIRCNDDAPGAVALDDRMMHPTQCKTHQRGQEPCWPCGRADPFNMDGTLLSTSFNRGMSLEAIAALLGHRSMRMTMVYARIANRTVAEEYFAVSEKVEALYDAPKNLPAGDEGDQMRKLRAEMHQRMLGNGYCARPVGLDCHFESICESCTFFQTTIEFRPILEKQRDDATAKGQAGRKKIFDGLLSRLGDAAS